MSSQSDFRNAYLAGEEREAVPVKAVVMAGALLKMLRELERVPVESDDGGHDECPVCHEAEWHLHAPDCRLDALLRRYKR